MRSRWSCLGPIFIRVQTEVEKNTALMKTQKFAEKAGI